MRKYFRKRQNRFIKMIRDQASLTLEGMDALKAYMAGNDPGAGTSGHDRLVPADGMAVDRGPE